MKEAIERCKNYVGVFCVNGCCPLAILEEYEELRHGNTIKNCNDCFYYGGCNDCALFRTEYCEKTRRGGLK